VKESVERFEILRGLIKYINMDCNLLFDDEFGSADGFSSR